MIPRRAVISGISSGIVRMKKTFSNALKPFELSDTGKAFISSGRNFNMVPIWHNAIGSTRSRSILPRSELLI